MNGWSSRHERRGGERMLVVTMDQETAEFIAYELPQGDGFTRDFARAVADTWPDEVRRGPGVSIVMNAEGLPEFRVLPESRGPS